MSVNMLYVFLCVGSRMIPQLVSIVTQLIKNPIQTLLMFYGTIQNLKKPIRSLKLLEIHCCSSIIASRMTRQSIMQEADTINPKFLNYKLKLLRND